MCNDVYNIKAYSDGLKYNEFERGQSGLISLRL